MTDEFTTAKKATKTEIAMLRLIHATPNISRVELAERSGLSTAAITGIVNALVARGLLIEEHEVFQRDVPGSQQRRLVYGDILDL